MQHQLVTAADLADALNRLRRTDPMWEEGGFRVAGRWLEIDPDASDELAARLLRCDLEEARARNDAEARWLVAGGVAVVYSERRGWRPAPQGSTRNQTRLSPAAASTAQMPSTIAGIVASHRTNSHANSEPSEA